MILGMMLSLSFFRKGKGFYTDFFYLTKWGMWFTYFTFVTGMFATR